MIYKNFMLLTSYLIYIQMIAFQNDEDTLTSSRNRIMSLILLTSIELTLHPVHELHQTHDFITSEIRQR